MLRPLIQDKKAFHQIRLREDRMALLNLQKKLKNKLPKYPANYNSIITNQQHTNKPI